MSQYEKYYNSFYRELALIDERHNNLEKISRFLPKLIPGARVLDIGCGHGSVSGELVTKGLIVHGMEINTEALISLQKKGIIAIEHNITQPFPKMEPFDLVLLLDVLEHVFDPMALMEKAAQTLTQTGKMIIIVPLCFDLIDRMRILFTGRIVSYDNRCYGPELYRRFRSYNYDHIRFFSPRDVLELCRLVGLTVDLVEYNPLSAVCFGRVVGWLVRIVANRLTVNLLPSILSHSMTVRVHR